MKTERAIIVCTSRLAAIRVASRLELSQEVLNVKIEKGALPIRGAENDFYVSGFTTKQSLPFLRGLAQGIEWAMKHEHDLVPPITKWQ
jgi:hypothetical protein